MKLFQSFKKGGLSLINSVVMAPMTRARNIDGVYNEQNALYYQQRSGQSGAGLIVTEGTVISPSASGMLFVPGIYTKDMIEGARLVTKAVHEKGSKVFTQVWHVGRLSHISLQPDHVAPVAPSSIQAKNSFAYAYKEDGTVGFIEASEPKALDKAEVEQVIQDFAQASENAIQAGFDGVELHGANGYLIEQFLNPFVNDRTDSYGGNVQNRVRFLVEVVDAAIEKIGSNKVGLRLSPFGTIQDMSPFEETEATFKLIAEEMSKRNIAYIHLMNQQIRGVDTISKDFLKRFRSWYDGTIIYAGGLSLTKAEELMEEEIIDLAAFGQPFISNPDLTYRLENNLPLTDPDRASYYGGDEKGYTDYAVYKSV